MRRYMNPLSLALLAMMLFAVASTAFSSPGNWFLTEILMLPGIIIGLSFHEYAHGIVAYKLGDPTPKFQGRLTINPKAHIDPFGFLALLFVGFGWGRPVEVNPYNFKKQRRDELLVNLAGVTMNLIIAIVFAFLYKIFLATGNNIFTPGIMGYIGQIIWFTIYINIVLMIFNLLPVPPLDGFGIVTEAFNLKRKPWYWQVYNNGFFILMILILFDVTDKVITPIIGTVFSMISLIWI